MNDPTHVLVFGALDDPTRDEIEVANAAVAALFDHGTDVDLQLDADALGGDYPERFAALEECCERVDPGRYRCALPACTDAVLGVLRIETWHRFAAVERLTVRRGEDAILEYAPDHRTFEVDADAASEVSGDVREALDGRPAALCPRDLRAAWSEGDRFYELDPPSLCVGETCHSLSGLRGIRVDRAAGEIALEWHRPDAGLLSRLARRFSPSPPKRLSPDDDAAFERAADAFERLAAELDLE